MPKKTSNQEPTESTEQQEKRGRKPGPARQTLLDAVDGKETVLTFTSPDLAKGSAYGWWGAPCRAGITEKVSVSLDMKAMTVTVYRRTKRVRTRNAKAKTMVLQRPEDEWIEIDGATPRIIEQQLWQRVQDILEDPERIRRKPEGRYYSLGSRVRCGMCGSAMVGQTLTNRGRSYRYYRCRHASTRTQATTAQHATCLRIRSTRRSRTKSSGSLATLNRCSPR